MFPVILLLEPHDASQCPGMQKTDPKAKPGLAPNASSTKIKDVTLSFSLAIVFAKSLFSFLLD